MRLKMNFIFVIALLLCVGCASNKYGGTPDEDDNLTITTKNLANYINTIPRLSVKNNQVYNASTSTFQQGRKPLFVLDGVQVGRDLSRMLSLIDD